MKPKRERIGKHQVFLAQMGKTTRTVDGPLENYMGAVDGECFQACGYPESGDVQVWPAGLTGVVKAAIRNARKGRK